MSQGYPQSWDQQPFQTPFDQGYQQQPAHHPGFQHGGHAAPAQQAPAGYAQPEGDFDFQNFDPSEWEEQQAPDGTFPFKITDAKIKGTKKGGTMAQIRLELQNGQGVFSTFNLKNDNPVAEQIGKQELVKLMKAVGLADLRGGLASFINRTGLVTISHKEDKEGTMRERLAFKALPSQPGQLVAQAPVQHHQQVPVNQPPVGHFQPNPQQAPVHQQTPQAMPLGIMPPPGSLPPSQMAQYQPPNFGGQAPQERPNPFAQR